MLPRLIFSLAVTACLLSLYTPASADDMEDANMALMKKFYKEVVNMGKVDMMDQLCATNFIEHEVTPGFEPNLEGVKKMFKAYLAAFPDLKFEVNMMLAKGDKVVSYITMSGTQKGPFMDMPASGKKFNTKAIDIIRFKDGKAVEHWGVTDSMAMMQQLGAVPEKMEKK